MVRSRCATGRHLITCADAVSEYEINRALRPHTKPIDSLDIIIRRIDRRRRDIANEVQTLDSELGEFREITAELPGIIRNQTCQSHKNYYEVRSWALTWYRRS